MTPQEAVELLDWKRKVFELYARIRAAEPRDGWEVWRAERDGLFKAHAQSPLSSDQRASFHGLDLYGYDARARTTGTIEPAEGEQVTVPSSRDEDMTFTRFGTVHFRLYETDCSLDLFWIGGYGGGLFLPFRDATSGHATYGAGRYLYDTIKGADLGTEHGDLVLDFNFAYNPSCAYDSRWSCPLAPAANLLELAAEAGEKAPV